MSTDLTTVPVDEGPIANLPEPMTPQECRVIEVNKALEPAYARASTLELTDAEIAALMAPFPDDAIEIRGHDGLIYIPHIEISRRLNQVFRPGKWAMVRRREWFSDGVMYGEYVLLIRGCFVGEAVGGHAYVASNAKTNYSDALESTRGEALRRIAGKCLSCGEQVWIPGYSREWCSKYARSYKANNGKTAWEKVMPKEQANVPQQPQKLKPDERISEEDWLTIAANLAKANCLQRPMLDHFGVQKPRYIPVGKLAEAMALSQNPPKAWMMNQDILKITVEQWERIKAEAIKWNADIKKIVPYYNVEKYTDLPGNIVEDCIEKIRCGFEGFQHNKQEGVELGFLGETICRMIMESAKKNGASEQKILDHFKVHRLSKIPVREYGPLLQRLADRDPVFCEPVVPEPPAGDDIIEELCLAIEEGRLDEMMIAQCAKRAGLKAYPRSLKDFTDTQARVLLAEIYKLP